MEKENKEIPFGSKDSELYKFEYTIPEGYEAEIKDGKVIVKKKESEDERIRKSLVEYFGKFKPGNMWNEVFSFGDVLSYLEKQKEQKPIPTEDEKDFLEKEVKAFLCNYDKEFDDDAPTYDIAEHFYQLGKNSQKPAEWSDSVAKDMFIKALERAVEQTKKGYELTDCDKHSWWEDFKAYSGIKPAEWSVDDERKRNGLIKGLEDRMGFGWASDPFSREDYIAWLKSLRPQPKQEWSEKDEDMLKSIIATCQLAAQDRDSGPAWALCKMQERFLKSFRSRPKSSDNWKPSKKQIDALNSIILIGSFSYVGQTQDLISLKDDLKKL